jgi:hypothetical protein
MLLRSPFHVYYRLDLEGETVELMSVWHEKRRRVGGVAWCSSASP